MNRVLTQVGLAGKAKAGCPVSKLLNARVPPEDAYRTYEQARGPKRWVCYPEGNHVCNNIIYKYRPLVADFMAEHLG